MKIRAQNGKKKSLRKRKEFLFLSTLLNVVSLFYMWTKLNVDNFWHLLYNFQFPRNCDKYSIHLLTHYSSTCVSRPNNCLCRFGMFLILNSAPKSTNTNLDSLWFWIRKSDQWCYVPDVLIKCLVWRERPRCWNDWFLQIGNTNTNQITPDIWSPWHVFSCPEQLNRWPCHWLTDSLTD